MHEGCGFLPQLDFNDSTTPSRRSQEGSFHRRGCWGPDDVSNFSTERWLFTVDDNDDSDDDAIDC